MLAAPTSNLDFEPNADRALAMDWHMRHGLAASLRHIYEATADQLEVNLLDFESFLNRLEIETIAPVGYSYYFDLVIALENGQIEEAKILWRQLTTLPPSPTDLQIVDLADVNTDSLSARYARFFISGTGAEFPIYPPSESEAAICRQTIKAAFDLMDAGDPLLAAEVRALVRQIILAGGSQDKSQMTFDGSSSFMMWGAILLNVNRSSDPLDMVQMLAHESAHNFLFGMTTEEPLTLNPDDERYASPLRKDPRPVDGIYHATFVSARMYRCMRVLLESGLLTPTQTEKAKKDLAENAALFHKGWVTIEKHGVLTEAGQGLMTSAAEAVCPAFASF